jgi:hypothetical protein
MDTPRESCLPFFRIVIRQCSRLGNSPELGDATRQALQFPLYLAGVFVLQDMYVCLTPNASSLVHWGSDT